MVAIVAGSGLGLFNASLNSLGGIGQPGSGMLGQTQGSGYVNMATGNLVLQALDEQRSGRGGDLYHLRSYNSLGQLNDADADGWRWDGERKLVLSGTVNTVGSTVTRTTGDGHETVYTWDATSSRYISPEGSGAHDSLTWNGTTSKWSWTDGSSRTVEVYTGSTGRLETVTDTTGNIISYGYDANGRLNSVKDNSSGQELVMAYDANGRLERLDTRTTSGGALTRQVYYAYDASGRLTSVTADLSPDDNSITDNNVYTTSYTYDSTSFRIASITQSDGTTVSFTYVLVGSEYRVQTVTDINGVTTFAYDTTNRRTDVTNGLGQQWTYTYDTNNQLVEAKTPAVNGQRLTTSYSYDAQGNVTQVADGRGNVIAYQYDANGNQILERDAVGNTVKRTYDANNQLQNEVHYTVPAIITTGTPSFSNNFDADTTGFQLPAYPGITRDGATGRLVFNSTNTATTAYPAAYQSTGAVAQSAGSRFKIEIKTGLVSAQRNLIAMIDNGGTYGSASYRRHGLNFADGKLYATYTIGGTTTNTQIGTLKDDTKYIVEMDATASGTIVRIYEDGQPGTVLTHALSYSDWGNVRLALQGLTGSAMTGLAEVYVDNVTVSPIQSPLLWTDPPAANALTTRYVYDSSSRLRFAISAEGSVTEYRYGTNGLRSKEIHFGGALYDLSSLLPADVLTEAQLTTWIATQAASRTELTDYSYDTLGNLNKKTVYTTITAVGTGSVSGAAEVTEYVYDAYSRLLQTISARGAGRSVKTTLSSVVYDGIGRVQSQTNANGTATTIYDGVNHQIRVTNTAGLTTTQTYDAQGHLSSVLQAAANEISRSTSYVYDAAGRLTMTQDPSGVRSYILYDEADRVSARIDGTGAVVEYAYNANGQVTSEIRYATLVDTTSWYNGTSVTKTLVSQIRPSTTVNDRKAQYSYDNANRLAMSVNPGGIATVYTYDGNDRLLQTQTMDRVTRFFYDKDGHQVGLLDAEGYLTENVYNSAGRLLNIRRYAPVTTAALRATGTLADLRPSTTGRLDIWNFYDQAGRLIGVLDDKQFFTQYTYDEANNQRKEIRYGPAYTAAVTTTGFYTVQGAVAATADFSTTVTDYDGMGRVLKVTNKEGTITQNEYDAAGRLVRSTVADATAEARTTRLRYNAFGELTGKITGEDADLVTVGMTETQIADVFAQHGLRYVYDVAGRQARVTDTPGNTSVYFYDAANRLTTVINGAGEVRETVYNTFGEQSEAASLSNRLSSSDRGDLASNGGGLLTQSVKDLVAAIRDVSKDSRTQYSYNTRGLLASKTDAEGYVSSYGYTSFGELDTETRTLSLSPSSTVATKYTYNKRSELLSTTIDATGLSIVRSQTYDAFGRLITQTDATGKVTNTVYSNAGRIIAVTDPVFHTQTREYDTFGRLLRSTDALGNLTAYAYDNATRSIKVTTPEGIVTTTYKTRHGEVLSVTDGNGNSTHYTYNKNGQLLTVTDAQNNVTTDNYYEEGTWQLYRSTDVLGNQITYEYDAAGRVITRSSSGNNATTHYAFDGQGRQVTVTDPQGMVTTYAYDRKGQVLTVTSGTYAASVVISTQYDGDGHVVRVEKGSPTAQNPDHELTTYVYDKAGRRISETCDPSGLNLTTQYKYDKEGRLTRKIDPLGNSTWYIYYANGLMSHSINTLGEVMYYHYDTNNRQISTQKYANRASTTGWGDVLTGVAVTADPVQDERTWTIYDRDGRARFQIDAMRQITERRYDANNNVIESIRYNSEDITPDTDVWSNTLDANYAGITDSGYLTTYADLFRYENGHFVLRSADGVASSPSLYSSTAIKYEAGYVFRAEIATGAVLPSRVQFGLMNDSPDTGNGGANRRHFLEIYNGKWRAVTVGGSSLDTYTVELGDADVNAHYVFEIETRIGGTTAYVYKEGQTRAQGLSHSFNTSGWDEMRLRLVAMRNPGFNGAEVTVDNLSIRKRTSDVIDGTRTRYVYDSLNRQRYEIDALGYVTEWRYDAAGHVTAKSRFDKAIPLSTGGTEAAVQAALTTAGTTATPPTTRYVYDTAGRLVYTIDALRHVTQNVYDSMDRVVANRNYADVLGAGVNLTAEEVSQALSTSQSQTTSYAYDTAGRVVGTINALGEVTARDYYGPLGNVYLDRKFPLRVTESTANLPWRSMLNELGASLNSYTLKDSLGRTKYTIDALKNVTEWVYDADSRVAQQIRYGRPLASVPDETLSTASIQAAVLAMSYTSAEKQITQYVYDKADRVRFTVDAAGNVSENIYNALGQVTETRRYSTPIGATAVTEAALTTAYTNATAVAKPRQSTRYVYDLLDRVRYTIDALGYVTENRFDAQGMQIEMKRYADTVGGTSLTLDALSGYYTSSKTAQSTRYAYDALGRLTYIIDSMGYVTARKYDAYSNVVKESRYDKPVFLSGDITPQSVSDAINQGGVWLESFDAGLGKVGVLQVAGGTSIVTQDGKMVIAPGTDPNQQLAGFATSSIPLNAGGYAFSTDVSTGSNVTNGYLILSFSAGAEKGSFVFRGQNTPAPAGTQGYPTFVWSANKTYTFEMVNDGASIHIYIHEKGMARSTGMDIPYPNVAWSSMVFSGAAVCDANVAGLQYSIDDITVLGSTPQDGVDSRVKNYVYDEMGRVRYAIDDLGHVTETLYDSYGHTQSVIRYDGKVSLTNFTLNTVHDQLLSMSSNSRVESYQYDDVGHVIKVTDNAGNFESYTYDAYGNKASFINKKGSVWLYTYDALSRLKEEASPDVDAYANDGSVIGSRSLVTKVYYDGFGNVIAKAEGLTRSYLNRAARTYTEDTDQSQARITRYIYDQLNRGIMEIKPGYYDSIAMQSKSFAVSAMGDLSAPLQIGNLPACPAGGYLVTVQTSYDGFGNIVKTSSRINNTGNAASDYAITHKAYDLLGRLVYEVDAMGG